MWTCAARGAQNDRNGHLRVDRGRARPAGAAGSASVASPAGGPAFARVGLLDADQAGGALDAARRAFPAWSALSFAERARHLERLRALLVDEADAVALLLTREQGKPAAEAHAAEIFPSLDALKHLAAARRGRAAREPRSSADAPARAQGLPPAGYAPYGVVLVITPWNYPFSIPLIGAATALAAGNTVVLKPAPATTLAGLRLGELCRKRGPARRGRERGGGGRRGGRARSSRTRASPRSSSRAASPPASRIMAAAATNLTPVVLELGGKDPAIVCRDADLDRAARGIVWGAFMNAGQTCASVERVYVETPVAEAFAAKVVEETRALRVGDPGAAETDMGPLTLERQRAIVEEHVADAVARGARGAAPAARARTAPAASTRPPCSTGVDHAHAGHARGDLRARAADHGRGGPRRGDPPGQRQRVRPHRQRLDARPADRAPAAGGAPGGRGHRQRLRLQLRRAHARPGAASSSSGIGRTHGRAGLREMVQAKYVAARPGARARRSGGTPTARSSAACWRARRGPCTRASLWSRLASQLAPAAASRRFWRRARPRARRCRTPTSSSDGHDRRDVPALAPAKRPKWLHITMGVVLIVVAWRSPWAGRSWACPTGGRAQAIPLRFVIYFLGTLLFLLLIGGPGPDRPPAACARCG